MCQRRMSAEEIAEIIMDADSDNEYFDEELLDSDDSDYVPTATGTIQSESDYYRYEHSFNISSIMGMWNRTWSWGEERYAYANVSSTKGKL